MKIYMMCFSFCLYSASVMGMPKKVSLTPLSSEEDFGRMRGGTLQNLASIHDSYPLYLIAPYNNDDGQRPNLSALRGLNIYDLSYAYPKTFVAKKSLDSIGGGHLI